MPVSKNKVGDIPSNSSSYPLDTIDSEAITAVRRLITSSGTDLENQPHYCALSGGLDSTVLLAALFAAGLRPTVLHVNHHRMHEAGAWEEGCRQLANQFGLKLEVLDGSIDAKSNLESELRSKRYRLLLDRVGNGVLWLAHHSDDQVEGFFLRLLRGSGSSGLVSLRAQRSRSKALLLRPFLALTKKDLAHFAEKKNLPWLEDPSNLDPTFSRNIWRHTILPLIQRYFPQFRQSVVASIQVLTRESEVLHDIASSWIDKYGSEDISPLASAALKLELSPLIAESHAFQSLIVRRYIQLNDAESPKLARLDEFIRQMDINNEAELTMLNGALRCWRGHLYWVNKAPQGLDFEMKNWQWMKSAPIAISHSSSQFVPSVSQRLWRDIDEDGYLENGLEGRRVIHPNNASHHTSLKKLLPLSGVPPWQRPYLPVIKLGDEVVYIPSIYVHPHWRASGGEMGMVLQYTLRNRNT